MLRHVGLAQIAVETLAQVGREALEHATELEDRVVCDGPGQRSDGEANRPRFRPAPLARPALEAGKVGVLEVHLDGPSHDPTDYCGVPATPPA